MELLQQQLLRLEVLRPVRPGLATAKVLPMLVPARSAPVQEPASTSSPAC